MWLLRLNFSYCESFQNKLHKHWNFFITFMCFSVENMFCTIVNIQCNRARETRMTIEKDNDTWLALGLSQYVNAKKCTMIIMHWPTYGQSKDSLFLINYSSKVSAFEILWSKITLITLWFFVRGLPSLILESCGWGVGMAYNIVVTAQRLNSSFPFWI